MTIDEKEKFDYEIDTLLEIFNKHSPIQNSKKIDTEKIKSCIEEMADFIIENKTECSAIKTWMSENEFYKSPASTKFHGDFDGGLCAHSLMVTVQALRFAKPLLENFELSPLANSQEFSAEDIFIACISHDFCKAGSYKIEFHNTKDFMGNWVKKPIFRTKQDLRNLGHGNESVLLLLESMPSLIKRRNVLEAVSRHMGFSDLSPLEELNYSNFLKNPLVLLIQLADQSAAAWWDL